MICCKSNTAVVTELAPGCLEGDTTTTTTTPAQAVVSSEVSEGDASEHGNGSVVTKSASASSSAHHVDIARSDSLLSHGTLGTIRRHNRTGGKEEQDDDTISLATREEFDDNNDNGGGTFTDDTYVNYDDVVRSQAAEPYVPRSVIHPTSSDDVSTVYEELPRHAFVLLPPFQQDHGENQDFAPAALVPFHGDNGGKDRWRKSVPHPFGTLVWLRSHAGPQGEWLRFKWYIPGIIDGYVFDDVEVTGYRVGIEAFNSRSSRSSMGRALIILLQNAPPEDIMLRWDDSGDTLPPCPIVDPPDRPTNNSTTQDRIRHWVKKDGDDLGYRGATQNGIGPHKWGITLQQLQDITEHPNFRPQMSMYDVVKHIIQPTTQGTGMGYALHLNHTAPLGATVVISHAWAAQYHEFLSVLSQSGQQGPFWVGATAVAQHPEKNGCTTTTELHYGPFATALKQADSLMAVTTTSCDLYSRLWCLYEMYVALSLSIPVRFTSFHDIMTTGGSGGGATYSDPVLDAVGRPVDTRKADCGNDKDKEMIYSDIYRQGEGGMDLIDDVIMWGRIKALSDDLPNRVRKSQEDESTAVPIGTCSESNIVARTNAGIAVALKVWKDAQQERRKHVVARCATVVEEPESTDDKSTLSSLSNIMDSSVSNIMDKLCTGFSASSSSADP